MSDACESIVIRIRHETGPDHGYVADLHRSRHADRGSALALAREAATNNPGTVDYGSEIDLHEHGLLFEQFSRDVSSNVIAIFFEEGDVGFAEGHAFTAVPLFAGSRRHFVQEIEASENHCIIEIDTDEINRANEAIASTGHLIKYLPLHFNFYDRKVGASSILIGHHDHVGFKLWTHNGFHPPWRAAVLEAA